jgi:hypothetical protein
VKTLSPISFIYINDRKKMLKKANTHSILTVIATIIAIYLPMPAQAVDLPSNSVLISTGIDFSSGKYGAEETTDMLYIPLTFKYATDQWSSGITIPYISLESSGDVVIGPDGRPVPIPGGGSTSESGLGDITASFTWFAYPGTEKLPIVDVTGRVKLPTADEDKGLGTGEFDWALETDLIKGLDRHSLFFTVGYKIFGDTDTVKINNVFYGSIGDSYRYNKTTSFGAFYDIREATTEFTEGMSELTGFISHRMNPKWKVMGYLVKGFSDGSPDIGAGVLFSRDTGFAEIGRIIPSLRRDIFSF